jgi:hypothetical protein
MKSTEASKNALPDRGKADDAADAATRWPMPAALDRPKKGAGAPVDAENVARITGHPFKPRKAK